MIIRRWNCIWMIIKQTRDKTTDDKTCTFKSLMYRWWLMNTTCNWFEIMYRKSPRIMITVPTNKIERMRPINIRINQSFFFDHNLKVTVFINCFKILWTSYIAFAKWRMLHQLSKMITITTRRFYWTK